MTWPDFTRERQDAERHAVDYDDRPTRAELYAEEQGDLLDLLEGERLREEGMAATEAADHTALNDGRDTELIDYIIASYNRGGEPWSANQLRAHLPRVRQPLIGARVRAAAMRKEMVRVGYEPSTLPSTHKHPIAVWKGVQR